LWKKSKVAKEFHRRSSGKKQIRSATCAAAVYVMNADEMTRYPSETQAERQARLASIRREIEAGTYETPDRLSIAVERLAADLEDRDDFSVTRPRKPK
jgi:anti-sigma28 factor (negative regulator of flagellin synthesis)